MCGPLAFLLLLLGPVALLFTAVAALGERGPVGVALAVLLVLGALVATRRAVVLGVAWWRNPGPS